MRNDEGLLLQRILKRAMWGVLALFCAALVLVLAWIASNWFDSEPQPWPEALTPHASQVLAKDNSWDALLAATANSKDAPKLTLGDCKDHDCSASWRANSSGWTAMRNAHAVLGAACETETQRRNLQLAEPLPPVLTPDAEIPRFQQIAGCSTWLLSLALEASDAGNADLATAKLAQSARLNTASLEGSQSLIGHMITLAIVDRHLQALQQVAIRHPVHVTVLQTLPLPTTAQIAAAQRRWVAYEASFQRSMTGPVYSGQACMDASGQSTWACRIGARAMLPNFTEQLLSEHWLLWLASVHDDTPMGVVNAHQAWVDTASSGLFGTQFHWRGTIPHIVFDVSAPAYREYFARSANTLLAAQTTQLWLQARSQAPEARAMWLGLQTKGTPLVGYLTIQPQGNLQLELLKSSTSFRLPNRWPAWSQ